VKAEYEQDEDLCGHWFDANRGAQSVTAQQLGRVELPTSNAGSSVQSEDASVTAAEQLGRAPSSREGEPLPAVIYAKCERGLLWRIEGRTSRICIPQSYRGKILNMIHENLTHPGAARAYEFAQRRYYWKSMRKDIFSYCGSCRWCQLVKTDTARKPGELNPIPIPAPLYTVCIDFVEALPVSRGCNSLATITEKFTRVVMLIPCKKNTSTEEFAKLFFHKVYPM